MPPFIPDTLASLKALEGHAFPASEWLTITQERVRQFAEATDDPQWIHLDPERARRESPYGGTIAHGFLTLSLMSYFLRQTISAPRDAKLTVNYGLNRVRFPAPVRVGARIRAHVAVQRVSELKDFVDATFNVSIEVEDAAKPCCVAEWMVRYCA